MRKRKRRQADESAELEFIKTMTAAMEKLAAQSDLLETAHFLRLTLAVIEEQIAALDRRTRL